MTASQIPSASLRLRPANAEDEAFLFRLFAESQQPLAGLLNDQALGHSLVEMQYRGRKMSWAAQYPDACDLILLAEDAMPVGRLLVDRKAARWRVVDIAVLAAHRGRGLGALMLAQCQRECRTAHARLELRVAPENPARRLYARLGFRVTGEDALAVEMAWNAADQERRENGSS